MGTLIASHSYPTLDQTTSQIRLIRLQPRLEGEKIICRLDIAELNDKACRYEALSYEWGEATSNSMHISLDGVDFGVRENLWWALYYLRNQETERILWIDALCINQSNEGERNHQVRLMGQIYAGAWRVVAWLRREDQEDFAQAVDLVNLLNGDSEETRYHIQARPQFPWGPPIWVNKTTNTKLSMDPVTLPGETDRRLGWLVWQRICYRTYWSRLWIIQELILASELVLRCSNAQVDWEAFSYIFGQIYGPRPGSSEKANGEPIHPSHRLKPPSPLGQNLGEPVRPAHAGVAYRIHQRRSGIFGDEPNSFTTLFGQFELYRVAKCVDVRDRIFGLLGISPKCC